MASGKYNITLPDSISITKSVQVNKILSNHKQNLVNVIRDNIDYIEIINQELRKTSKDNRLLTICDVVLDNTKPNVFIDYDSLVQLIELFNDARKPKTSIRIKGLVSKKARNSYRLSRIFKKISNKTKKSHTPTPAFELMNNMRTMMSGVDHECLTLLDEIKEIDYFKDYNFKCLSVNALEKLIITQIDEQIVMTEMQLESKAEEAEKQRWKAIITKLNFRLKELRKK